MFRLVAMMVGTLCRKLGRPSDRLVEIDPNIFRVVVGINPHLDNLAGLHGGSLGGSEKFSHDGHALFATRDMHCQFDYAQIAPRLSRLANVNGGKKQIACIPCLAPGLFKR